MDRQCRPLHPGARLLLTEQRKRVQRGLNTFCTQLLGAGVPQSRELGPVTLQADDTGRTIVKFTDVEHHSTWLQMKNKGKQQNLTLTLQLF